MRLTRKKAIELCIEAWTWLTKTGKKKRDWPEWEKYEKYGTFSEFSDEWEVESDCWFCEYDSQHQRGCCSCPLDGDFNQCLDMYYGQWDSAKTPRTRKKYAGLFLKQIKSIEQRSKS